MRCAGLRIDQPHASRIAEVIHHRELPTLEALADAALYKTLVATWQRGGQGMSASLCTALAPWLV